MQSRDATGAYVTTILSGTSLVKAFQYNPTILNALRASTSADRLGSYLQHTGDDLESALHLYLWNGAISAAFYLPLQGLEVSLRNGLHRELSRVYGSAWYAQSPPHLGPGETHRIRRARESLIRSKKPVVPSRLIAELSFGFWVSLLGAGPQGRYHNTLWTPALSKTLPNTNARRKQVHQILDILRTLRNRIAHHEPVFQRHLERDYEHIIEVISWICADTAGWIDHHNTFREVFALRPDVS